MGRFDEKTYKKGDVLFREGEVPRDAYIVKEGLVDVAVAEHHFYTAKPGRLFGINSLAMDRDRKASATCVTDSCVVKSIPLKELRKLSNEYPLLESTLKELALRQEFRRAIVLRRMKSFPNKDQMKEAFDEIDQDRSGTLNKDELRLLMASLGAAFTDEDFIGLVSTLDVNESGEVGFNEFQNIFNES